MKTIHTPGTLHIIHNPDGLTERQLKKASEGFGKRVARIVNGQRVVLDVGIADLIVMMNKKQFKTRFCCSGIKADHPRGERSLRTQIRCPLDAYTGEKILQLLNLIEGVATIGFNYSMGSGRWLDIEFHSSQMPERREERGDKWFDNWLRADIACLLRRFSKL